VKEVRPQTEALEEAGVPRIFGACLSDAECSEAGASEADEVDCREQTQGLEKEEVQCEQAPQDPLWGRDAWEKELQHIRNRWLKMQSAWTGVAEVFRGNRKVRWVQNDCRMEVLMPDLVITMLKSLATLIETHEQVMGAVNKMLDQGGSKEALAVIHALRSRQSITGQWAAAMDSFIAESTMMHRVVCHELFQAIAQNQKVAGQLPCMQRIYLDSYTSCCKLRDDILNEWHHLTLNVTDAMLEQEFQRCRQVEKEAYVQLMQLPVILPALGNSAHTEKGQPQSAPLQLLTNAPANSSVMMLEDEVDGPDERETDGRK